MERFLKIWAACLILAALGLVAGRDPGPAATPATPPARWDAANAAETRDTVVEDVEACRTSDDFVRLMDLAIEDVAAATKFKLSHSCRTIGKGTRVTVDQLSHSGVFQAKNLRVMALVCLRPQGQPDCLWTSRALAFAK